MTDQANPGRWACISCSYAYDPRNGDDTQNVARGTLFDALPEDWRCPWCGAGKNSFVPEAEYLKEMEQQ